MTTGTDASGTWEDEPGDGQDLVQWALSDRCTKVVRNELKKAGLPSGPQMVEDLEMAVWQNIEGHVERNPGATYRNVPGYGRSVVRNTLRRLASGRLPLGDEDLDQVEDRTTSRSTSLEDATRIHLEQQGGPPWVLGAALAYATLLCYPDARPADLPAPQAGAKEADALGWPALWLAGVRDVFPGPGGDTRRGRRNRSVRLVRARLAAALGAALDEGV